MYVNLKSFDALALVVAILSAIVLLLSGPGYRVGAWSLPTAFMLLRWGAYGGILAAAMASGALWRVRGRSVFAVLALIIGVTTVGIPLRFQRAAASAPPIHDITTDTANPPTFKAVVPARANAPNTLEYSQEVARQQRERYPDIKPLILEMPAPQVFERALQAARNAGWEIVATDADAGRIEATDTTTFFGFKDDIVVRLTPIGSRSVVDVRSVSRVGRGDVGTNARRIREYLKRLSQV
ncbi:MAG TPA: DUF1499 domain-containing protein [Vicinamibacterales bacterium]|nr:DUF1499 domain-containing protein [Vicinamibacterales bacterium]